MKRPDAVLLGLIALFVIVIIPVFGGNFWTYAVALVGMYSVAVIGLNICMGIAGLFSLGTPVFMMIGGYFYGVLATHDHINAWVGSLIGVVLACVAAIIIGFPTLRLRSHYFAIATLGMLLAGTSVVSGAQTLTGGTIGIPGVPALNFFGIDLQQQRPFYIFIWACVAILTLVTFLLRYSRPGRAFRAIASSEEVASSLGINVRWTKVLAFFLSGLFGAISGVLLVNFETYLSPDFFDSDVAVLIFAMLFLGGVRSYSGPIIGAAVIEVIPLLVTSFGGYATIAFEVVLLIILMTLPGGVGMGAAQLVDDTLTRFMRQLGRSRQSTNVGANR